jgi:microcystin-dependent protein
VLNALDYPEYAAWIHAGGTTPDTRGFVIGGRDNMGGASAGRLTQAYAGYGIAGIPGYTPWAGGGHEVNTLVEARIPSHRHVAYTYDPGHLHYYRKPQAKQANSSFGGSSDIIRSADDNQWTYDGNGQVANTLVHDNAGNYNYTALTGSSWPHENLQPTMIMNKMLVVE